MERRQTQTPQPQSNAITVVRPREPNLVSVFISNCPRTIITRYTPGGRGVEVELELGPWAKERKAAPKISSPFDEIGEKAQTRSFGGEDILLTMRGQDSSV